MFCPHCHNKIPDGSNICPLCYSNLAGLKPQQTAEPKQPQNNNQYENQYGNQYGGGYYTNPFDIFNYFFN